jgi:hypothetical protein
MQFKDTLTNHYREKLVDRIAYAINEEKQLPDPRDMEDLFKRDGLPVETLMNLSSLDFYDHNVATTVLKKVAEQSNVTSSMIPFLSREGGVETQVRLLSRTDVSVEVISNIYHSRDFSPVYINRMRNLALSPSTPLDILEELYDRGNDVMKVLVASHNSPPAHVPSLQVVYKNLPTREKLKLVGIDKPTSISVMLENDTDPKIKKHYEATTMDVGFLKGASPDIAAIMARICTELEPANDEPTLEELEINNELQAARNIEERIADLRGAHIEGLTSAHYQGNSTVKNIDSYANFFVKNTEEYGRHVSFDPLDDDREIDAITRTEAGMPYR